MAIIAIARIFLLTQQYPTLIREITTPLLSPFITACLQILSSKTSEAKINNRNAKLFPPVLEALSLLLPYHPATFRPFTPRIHKILLDLLTEKGVASVSKESGRHLFAALHFCAAKNATSSEWEAAVLTLITSVHVTADQVFRSILEDWEPSDDKRREKTVQHNYDEEVGAVEDDPLHLPGWESVGEGAARIIELLALISAFLQSSSAAVVAIPVGHILDLTFRLSSVLIPGPDTGSVGSRANPEVGRAEREELYFHLPRIHQATMNVYHSLVTNLGSACFTILPAIMEQASWIFGANMNNDELRDAQYDLVGLILPLVGSSFTKLEIRTLTATISSCSSDILAIAQSDDVQNNVTGQSAAKGQSTTNVDSFLKPHAVSASQRPSLPKRQPEAAWALLPSIYQFLPSSLLPRSLRAELDRTAIVANHREAILASILNPPSVKGKIASNPSLLSWLARTNNNDIAFEGLLRPRMPVIHDRQPAITNGTSHEHEDENDCGNDNAIGFHAVASDLPAPWDVQPQSNKSPSAEDPSLLDRLEDSLSAASPNNASRSVSNPPNPSATVPSILAITAQPTLQSPQKRDFAQLQQPPPPSPISPSGDLTTIKSSTMIAQETSSKRPRTDQFPLSFATASSNLISENVATSASTTTSISANTPVTLPNTSSSSTASVVNPINASLRAEEEAEVAAGTEAEGQNRGGQDEEEGEEDESDFEMPEINLEPDTDDEVEGEEGDEDEEMER